MDKLNQRKLTQLLCEANSTLTTLSIISMETNKGLSSVMKALNEVQQITCPDLARPTPQPNNAPTERPIRRRFAELRQLRERSLAQTRQENHQGIVNELTHEQERGLTTLEMRVSSHTRLDVLAAIQNFLLSNQSFEQILNLSNELNQIGLQAYRKSMGADNGKNTATTP